MALRQQSLPFIYGYRNSLNTVVKELKAITKRQEDEILKIILSYKDYIDFSADPIDRIKGLRSQYNETFHECDHERTDSELLLAERDERIKNIANQILAAIEGWADPIQASLFTTIYNSSINGYYVGYRDGTQKLVNSIKKYKGQYRAYVNDVIRAIRAEEVTVPASIRSDIEESKKVWYANLIGSLSIAVSTSAATVIIKTSIDDAEKHKELERSVRKVFSENKSSVNTGRLILWGVIGKGLITNYINNRVRFHTWVIDNPEDTPCIMPAGETVPVGQPFSNGFVWAGDVHRNCHCTTVATDVTDDQMKEYIIEYGL